jgi:hypothetical protein
VPDPVQPGDGQRRLVRKARSPISGGSPFPSPGTSGPVKPGAWLAERLGPEPAPASLTGRAREWGMTRYRSYQAQLAAQPIGETFSRATAFLRLAVEGSSLSHR